jgi:hypothetical protein
LTTNAGTLPKGVNDMMTSTPDAKRRRPIRLPRIGASTYLNLQPGTLQVLALILSLALLAWVGLSQLSTPDVVPSTASASEFSAERAMEHLRVIAAEPRPGGSEGHTATQQYLMNELRAFGLDPEIQATTVVAPGEAGVEGFGAGYVENVIARIPGTDNTGAIALDAHYDSGATGPGAMDAGAGVVSVLETVRVIQNGPALMNDVIVVFADGEEIGMLGAAALNNEHPWAEDIQLTLNFEGAGGNGTALLYATSKNNSWLTSEFLDIAPDPAAYSLLPTIVHLYPDARLDCDLGEYTDKGSAGLGFVSVGDTPAYHTLRDNPDLIDPGSIKQMGGYTLAATQHFGNLDLSDLPENGDRVFFNVLPGTVVHYASGWVVPLAALITGMIFALTVIGYRRNEMSIGGLAVGVATFLLGTIGATALAILVWFAIRTLNSDYQVMMIGSYQSGLYVVALIFTTIAAIAALYTLLRRRVLLYNLAGGALVGALVPLWFASLVVPGMSYLVTWPVLFAILPLAWILLAGKYGNNAWGRVAMLTVAAIPALLLLPGTLYAMTGFANRLEGLMGMPILGVVMLFVAPPVALLVLHLDFLSGDSGWRRWAVPVTAALLALVLIGWGNATSGFDVDQPWPDRIAYELNADTGQAQWISRDQNLDHWTGQFFPAGAERTEYDSLLVGIVPAFTAEAATTFVAVPEIDVLSDTVIGDMRTLEVRLLPAGARMMVAQINAPGPMAALAVDGQSVDIASYEWADDGEFPIVNANVPAEGWELSISVRSTEEITIEIETAADGLPGDVMERFQPRPDDTMPAPDYARDPTVVKKTFHF